MKTEQTFSALIAVAVGALSSYFLKLFIPLVVLLLVMLLDWITGLSKAWKRGELSSRVGLQGLIKKVGYLAIVVVAGVMDWLFDYGLSIAGIDFKLPFLVAAIVMVWLIINELISILENVAALGVPVPPFIKKLLARLKKTVDDKTGENEPEEQEEQHD